jgi:hypothetical protein
MVVAAFDGCDPSSKMVNCWDGGGQVWEEYDWNAPSKKFMQRRGGAGSTGLPYAFCRAVGASS